MPYLVLVRHGQTTWNELGRLTGLTDVELTPKGREEARKAAKTLDAITFGSAYTSKLKRAQDTLSEILHELNQTQLEAVKAEQLNERSYGLLEGKLKEEVRQHYSEKEWKLLHRGWNFPIPEGETMKDVDSRVIPFYKEHILTDLKSGKNVIVAAHGNVLRTLVKYLEDISDDAITNLEIGNAEVYAYEVSEDGRILAKKIENSGSTAI